jgi:putative SOS response-associated peptidase YedK
MCGRYAIEYPPDFADRFNLSQLPPNLQPNYNAAPGQTLPVILKRNSLSSSSKTKTNTNDLKLMQWGLIPFWAKDSQIGYKMINARAETVAQKPSYKRPFAHQRCLVPAIGFYEWQKDGKTKLPHYIHLQDNSLISFAGLYDTTNPTKTIKPIHNRMPVILQLNQEAIWLSSETQPTQLHSLLETPKALNLEAYPVSKLVNSPKNNSPNLIKPLKDLPQTQTLF